MKPREGKMLLVIAMSICGLAQVAAAQAGVAVDRPAASLCASGNSLGMVTVHVAQRGTPYLSLCEGHALGGSLAQLGQAQPLALASGDFDEDGHWDVVKAQLGSNALYFLKGDGHGGFAAPQRIPLLEIVFDIPYAQIEVEAFLPCFAPSR
jgi:hypothetical protein